MIKKLLSCFVLILFLSIGISARAKYSEYVEVGGKSVKTSTLTTYLLMETFPNSTITIYEAGTITLATIYSNNIGTVKSNPFNADSKAYYEFYADNGFYDIKFSGTGISSPFTRASISLSDPQDEYNPKSFGAKCDNSTNDTTVFTAIKTIIGSNNSTIGMPKTICRLNTISFPRNITFNFNSSGGIYSNTSNTITILGDEIGPKNIQRFYNATAGLGTIIPSGTTEIYPQWWGAIGNGTFDDSPAINAAFASNDNIQIKFLPTLNAYSLGSPVYITKQNQHIIGAGIGVTFQNLTSNISVLGGPNAFFINVQNISNIEFQGLRFHGNNAFSGWIFWTVEGGGLNGLFSSTIEHCFFDIGVSAQGILHGSALDFDFLNNRVDAGLALLDFASASPSQFSENIRIINTFLGVGIRGFVRTSGVVNHVVISNTIASEHVGGNKLFELGAGANDIQIINTSYTMNEPTGVNVGGVISADTVTNLKITNLVADAVAGSNMVPLTFTNSTVSLSNVSLINYSGATPPIVSGGLVTFSDLKLTGISKSSLGSLVLSGLLTQSEGATLTISSNTIVPTNSIHIVGTGLIKTITAPSNFSGTIYLIAGATPFTMDNTGNIITPVTTPAANDIVTCLYASDSKWHCK